MGKIFGPFLDGENCVKEKMMEYFCPNHFAHSFNFTFLDKKGQYFWAFLTEKFAQKKKFIQFIQFHISRLKWSTFLGLLSDKEN